MRIRRCWLVVAVLLVPTAAGAHDHTADAFGGPSFGGGSKLGGLNVSFAVAVPNPLDRDLSVLGDLGVHLGSHSGQRVTRIGFMGGVRYTFPGRPDVHKNRFSVHGLAGAVRNHTGAQVDLDLAGAVGGGWEFLPRGDTTAAGWAYRVQADYVAVKSAEDFLRVSGGVVYRFKNP